MKTLVYYLLIISPFAIVGAFLGANDIELTESPKYFSWIVMVYIPIVAIARMKYMGYTKKEMLMSIIPFYGIKYRFRLPKKK